MDSVPAVDKIFQKSGIRCCIQACGKSRRYGETIRMFKFPPYDSVMGKIWREKCNIPRKDYTKKLLICANHFSSSDIGKKKLKFGAVPVFNLEVIEEDYKSLELDCPAKKSRTSDFSGNSLAVNMNETQSYDEPKAQNYKFDESDSPLLFENSNNAVVEDDDEDDAESIPPAKMRKTDSARKDKADDEVAISSYEEALRHLKPLEDFVLLEENFRAIGVISQLEAIFRNPKQFQSE